MKQAAPPYWLYLLECEGGSYYAGVAIDVEQRFFLHVFGRGARYTRAHPPLRVLAAAQYASKGEALKAEYRLKQLPRGDKLAFFAQPAPQTRADAPYAAVMPASGIP